MNLPLNKQGIFPPKTTRCQRLQTDLEICVGQTMPQHFGSQVQPSDSTMQIRSGMAGFATKDDHET